MATKHIPSIGPAFLVQAGAFFAMSVLIVVGAPDWMVTAAGLGSAGTLVAFALSRTVGLFGFSEHGWEPAPYAMLSVLTELAAVALASVSYLPDTYGGQSPRPRRPRRSRYRNSDYLVV